MLINNKCIRFNCEKEIDKTRRINTTFLSLFQRDFSVDLSKEKLESLCNGCSTIIESFLLAYYNCKLNGYGSSGGNKGRWEYDTKNQIIKIWESDKIWEFDLGKRNFLNNFSKLING